jgi:hypothetical protein
LCSLPTSPKPDCRTYPTNIYRKHLKLEGKAELLTFALATISSRYCCSNYLLFGKVQSAVAPFLCTSEKVDGTTFRKHFTREFYESPCIGSSSHST